MSNPASNLDQEIENLEKTIASFNDAIIAIHNNHDLNERIETTGRIITNSSIECRDRIDEITVDDRQNDEAIVSVLNGYDIHDEKDSNVELIAKKGRSRVRCLQCAGCKSEKCNDCPPCLRPKMKKACIATQCKRLKLPKNMKEEWKESRREDKLDKPFETTPLHKDLDKLKTEIVKREPSSVAKSSNEFNQSWHQHSLDLKKSSSFSYYLEDDMEFNIDVDI